MRQSLAEHLPVESVAAGLELRQPWIGLGHQCIDGSRPDKAFELNVVYAYQNAPREELRRRPNRCRCPDHFGRRSAHEQWKPIGIRDFFETKGLVDRRTYDREVASLLCSEIADIDPARTH